ncbi:MAG: hypothetical protein ACTSYX_11440, partial [Candidatus Thorarchaeota archaeon]
HQGVEEISVEAVRAAHEEVASEPEPQPAFAPPFVGSPMGAMMAQGGPPSPEMMAKMLKKMSPEMREQLLSNPDALPPPARAALKRALAEDDGA